VYGNLAARNRDANLSRRRAHHVRAARINLVSEIAPALGVSAEDAEALSRRRPAKGVLREPASAVKKKA